MRSDKWIPIRRIGGLFEFFLFHLFRWFILILFTSCSTESETADTSENQSNLEDEVALYRADINPANSSNTYDAAGQLYYDISDSYHAQGKTSLTTSGTIEQVETIANLNEEFQTLRPAT